MRSAALLEKAGFEVQREYYINDAGAQVDVLARSAHLRYREALGETIGAIPEGLYPGEYLKEPAARLASATARNGSTGRKPNGSADARFRRRGHDAR